MAKERKTFVLLVAVLVAVFAVDRIRGQSGGPCTTLRRMPGICVPILTCGSITQLLSLAPRPLSPSVTFLVRQAHCGIFNNVHHACCEPNRVTGDEIRTTTATPTTIRTRTRTTTTTTTTSSPASAQPNVVITPGDEKSEAEVQAGIALLEGTLCGKSDADKLANGVDANLSEYPWMALLVYYDGLQRTLDCGGSLIHERYVLTAAHCIRVGNKKLVSVRLGEHDILEVEDCIGISDRRKCAPPIQEIDVEEAIYHKDYNPSKFSDDVGIVRLVRNAVIATNVKPICLPITPASRATNFDRMIISGWGRVESGLKANILQKAVVPIKSVDYCQQIHRLIKITQKQLCAGGENEIDTCKGDSGGPMFYAARYKNNVRYIQYGIVSAGSVLCGSNYPGIYVRVEAYLPWIAGNLNSV